MNSWAPLWSGIVESSIWDEEDYVVKVFLTMMAIKDSDHVVRKSAYQLSKLSRKSEAEVLEALKVLAAPDSKRLEPQRFEGRRIEGVEDGWKILNGEKYREMISKEMERARNRRSQEAFRRREKEKSGNVQDNAGQVGTSTPRFQKPTIAELTSEGLSQDQAEAFFHHFESNGWKVGGKAPMKSWKSAVVTWKKRSGDFQVVGSSKNGNATSSDEMPFTNIPYSERTKEQRKAQAAWLTLNG